MEKFRAHFKDIEGRITKKNTNQILEELFTLEKNMCELSDKSKPKNCEHKVWQLDDHKDSFTFWLIYQQVIRTIRYLDQDIYLNKFKEKILY